ncbi:von Willebrand factor A domain-containing protein 5B1 [Callorhinchus milii]|uniref:von Willebrand factor A domain-containing protein 5B1 n=1 Tax=Callorhinchus milii TaxID=7868 RepID=UPI001C3F8B01|nr:von Willebrand factor A domain-containing protein 5B1 [Callorhinchus milii]
MPGLINQNNGSNLPLTSSEVTSCMMGYTLGISASLTYANPEDHPIEGLFIYPLGEHTAVVGFEAFVSGRIITVQIKDKAKLDDYYFDCCGVSNGVFQHGSGHLTLDEDLERTMFVVSLGVIPALEIVSVVLSTSSELQTLPSGAVRVLLSSVYTPRVLQPDPDVQSSAENQFRSKDRHRCDCSPRNPAQSGNRLCLARCLDEEVTNPSVYEFSFQLEIRGPCLLAGVESPTHSIRVDADPKAFCASSVVVTLAKKHTCDRPVEIVIHPSEPHLPHILMEGGDMSPDEYEQHLKGKSDFIKGSKKDPSSEKKTEIIRKRLNKDIPHNPVVMLNFCPNLKAVQPDLRRTQGEFIFLIDRSGSMSGVNIGRVKDAMIVVLKSLVPSCLFNIIGFGSTFRTLFPASRPYNEDTLALACEHVKKMRADMGGTNISAPLSWILRQPAYRGHPLLLFLLTDGAVNNTGKVIESVRAHAHSTRCFSFGIGQNACRRLVLGLASVSKGAAEFLGDGERLQPKMVTSLKKAMMPVLSDVTIEWLFPETTEVLLSPVGPSTLFPGDRLVGYSVICDTSRYHSNPRSEKRRRYSMMWSQDSSGSVFYHSLEEESDRGFELASCSRDSAVDPGREVSREVTLEEQECEAERDLGIKPKTSPRRRAYSANQLAEQGNFKRYFTSSDPSSALSKNPLRRARAQQLVSQRSPEAASLGQGDWQLHTKLARSKLIDGRRPSLLHQNCVSTSQDLDSPLGQTSLHHTATPGVTDHGDSTTTFRSSTESTSASSCSEPGKYHVFSPTLKAKSPQGVRDSGPHHSKPDCKAVISGLLSGEVLRWEVTFDLGSLLDHGKVQGGFQEDPWNETVHHLAAKSVIRDFEQMAEKECEIEHGSGRRYQLNVLHTSKACNIISKYRAFVPVYLENNEYLPNNIEYSNSAPGSKSSNQRSSHTGSQKHRTYSVGLGRSQSGYGSDGGDDGFAVMSKESSLSPCSAPTSSGWERCSFTEAPQRSLSVSSQRSIESLFTARLSLSKARMLTRAAKGFMSRSPSKASDSICKTENENNDYLPLITLQLASGAFLLDEPFCEAVSIPMEKLRWSSPFPSHRATASPTVHSCCSPARDRTGLGERGAMRGQETGDGESLTDGSAERLNLWAGFDGQASEQLGEQARGVGPGRPPDLLTEKAQASSPSQADSGRGSETDCSEALCLPSGGNGGTDPGGTLWATAVALAWLEHSSATSFIEWELVAAKASTWLNSQPIPEGRDLPTIKASARQLFVLLRHWDENLQLNVLCYNPNSV